MKLRDIVIGLAGLAVFVSCNSDRARLDGHFIGAAGGTIYLERVVPGVAVPMVDTVVADQKGEFAFRVALPGGEPTIFNLRYGSDMVPLLISPGERVRVLSLADLDGYRVSGSPESELVWRLHGILAGGAASLDSISAMFGMAGPDPVASERMRRAWLDKYLNIKRRHISFIVENPGSLAAVYALYQRLPGDEVLFNGENDHVYYRMVADSVRKNYPDSRYVRALDAEIAALTAQRDFENRLAEEVTEADFPEVELNDMYGVPQKLSAMAGKVIVLDFWTATSSDSRLNNADMKELWATLSGQGLAIYQVSLDTSRPLWVNAVQEQRLPWTTVCDFRGEATMAARVYNIDRVPCNFVINRAGEIVARNLYGDDLERKVRELL